MEEQTLKQRHGCVTAWLIFIIVINAIVAIYYLAASGTIADNLPGNVSEVSIILLALFGLFNILCAVALLHWKKIGFWGFILSCIAIFGVNLSIGIELVQSLLGFAGIGILYAILQIKKDGVSTWNNLI